MNTDELLNVIEQGLKDVRADLLKRKHPDKTVRRAMTPEARLDELEWAMSGVQSDLAVVKSTVRILEMNVAKLKAASAERAAGTAAVQPAGRRRSTKAAASTTPSPETHRATAPSRSRGRRV